MYIQIILTLLIHILLIHFYLLRKEQISLILIPLLYIFLKIYNLKIVLECGPRTIVAISIVRIVVVAIIRSSVATIRIIVITSDVSLDCWYCWPLNLSLININSLFTYYIYLYVFYFFIFADKTICFLNYMYLLFLYILNVLLNIYVLLYLSSFLALFHILTV